MGELCFYIFRESRKELTFVLIGVLGSGKSSTGNSILGHKQFKVTTGTVPVTQTVEEKYFYYNERKITVVDTPGLKNASSFTSIKKDVDKLLINKSTNIIYLITIKIGRYTKEERQILDHIFKTQKTILTNVMIIFTNRSELMEEDGTADLSVDQWINQNPSLSKWINVNKLKHRAFENKRSTTEENGVQVKDLIDAVDDIDTTDDHVCPVSGNLNIENKIYVDKKTLGKKFGEYGFAFFEEQEELQSKNMESSTIFVCSFYPK